MEFDAITGGKNRRFNDLYELGGEDASNSRTGLTSLYSSSYDQSPYPSNGGKGSPYPGNGKRGCGRLSRKQFYLLAGCLIVTAILTIIGVALIIKVKKKEEEEKKDLKKREKNWRNEKRSEEVKEEEVHWRTGWSIIEAIWSLFSLSFHSKGDQNDAKMIKNHQHIQK